MSATFEIRGDREIRKALARWTNPKITPRLQRATKAGGNEFKAPAKSEARAVSKRLAKSVSLRRANRDRPATILTFRPKVAFFRHFLIGGTRDHGPRKAPLLVFVPGFNQYSGAGHGVGNKVIRTRRVRGLRPNPVPQRAFDRGRSSAERAIVADLSKE